MVLSHGNFRLPSLTGGSVEVELQRDVPGQQKPEIAQTILVGDTAGFDLEPRKGASGVPGPDFPAIPNKPA